MKTGLRFNIAKIASSFKLDRDIPTLAPQVTQNISAVLLYSCRHWSHHLRRIAATSFDEIHLDLSSFIKFRVLFWIEAMNVLGLRGYCSEILKTAGDWIKEVSIDISHDWRTLMPLRSPMRCWRPALRKPQILPSTSVAASRHYQHPISISLR